MKMTDEEREICGRLAARVRSRINARKRQDKHLRAEQAWAVLKAVFWFVIASIALHGLVDEVLRCLR